SEKTDNGHKELVDDTLEPLREYGMRLNCLLKFENTPSLHGDLNNMRLFIKVINSYMGYPTLQLEVLSALKCLGCELTDEDKMFIKGEIRMIHSCAPF
ncbi:hypothetical protein ACI65C_007917, partial [Semiaphis heraclei]